MADVIIESMYEGIIVNTSVRIGNVMQRELVSVRPALKSDVNAQTPAETDLKKGGKCY